MLRLGYLRKAIATVGVIGAAAALYATVAVAGSSGQQLSLHDVGGWVYSAQISGYNQSCSYAVYGISNWQYKDYDIPGWWWQGSGSPCEYQVRVDAFASSNYNGYMYEWFYLNGPPQSQSSDWWSCEVDGNPVACASGLHAFG
jgi:hypothetical protein